MASSLSLSVCQFRRHSRWWWRVALFPFFYSRSAFASWISIISVYDAFPLTYGAQYLSCSAPAETDAFTPFQMQVPVPIEMFGGAGRSVYISRLIILLLLLFIPIRVRNIWFVVFCAYPDPRLRHFSVRPRIELADNLAMFSSMYSFNNLAAGMSSHISPIVQQVADAQVYRIFHVTGRKYHMQSYYGGAAGDGLIFQPFFGAARTARPMARYMSFSRTSRNDEYFPYRA